MMCECCGKRPARLSVTMITNGKSVNRHFCPQCAARLQRGDAQSVQFALLGAMAADDPPQLLCPACGCTSEQFLRSGRLGCAACYDAFAPILGRIFMQIDGALHHEAPVQSAAQNADNRSPLSPSEMQLEQLRGELYQAVSEENYERAAVLRDEIRALESEEQQP